MNDKQIAALIAALNAIATAIDGLADAVKKQG